MNEVFTNILDICTKKHLTNEIFGCAMTLFHYYTFHKSFKEFDRCEISVACVFLACKIEYSFLKIEESNEEYIRIKRSKTSRQLPDYVKFEIEILSFLDFEIDIATPFFEYYHFLYNKFPQIYSDSKIRNFSLKLIYDTYRKPLCIYFNSKCIALAVLFLSLNILEGCSISIQELMLIDKSIDSNSLVKCLECIINMFDTKIEIPNL